MFQFFSKIDKVLRLMRTHARVFVNRLRLGWHAFPSDFSIADGVLLKVTDGGSIRFGSRCCLDRFSTVIVKKGSLSVGAGGYIGVGSVIVARESISIGTGALIAEHVTIRDQDHAIAPTEGQGRVGFTSSPIVIGDNVWLGAKVTVIQGVTIGNNVVVGANSVVTHDLPDNCVAVGAPARVVHQLKAG